jgi:hypothetical protein
MMYLSDNLFTNSCEFKIGRKSSSDVIGMSNFKESPNISTFVIFKCGLYIGSLINSLFAITISSCFVTGIFVEI